MDPNENLRLQLALAARIIYRTENDKAVSKHDSAELAELVIALDAWIRGGGFVPETWSATKRGT